MNGIGDINFEALGLGRPRNPQPETDLGQEQFLRLMITQFQNQDPFQPMENGEFLGQLAQFGTVTGISELKEAFDGFFSSLVSDQSLQAASLVGQTVMADMDVGYLEAGSSIKGAVDVPAGASSVTVRITDANGSLVRELDLGPRGKGFADFEWNGFAADGTAMPAGQYTVTAQVIAGGRVESATTLIAAEVDSVTLNVPGVGLLLNLEGLGNLPFSQVRRIG